MTQPRPGDTPRYRRPSADRMEVAVRHLAVAEQFAGPSSQFVVTGLIRALIALGCTTAEAMWVIHDQIAAGRYQRWPLHEMPKDTAAPYWVDGCLPGGLTEAKGRLSVETVDGSDWGWLGVTLPVKDNGPIIGLADTQPAGNSSRKRGRPEDTDRAEDKRVYDAWQTSQHRTKAELAAALGENWTLKKVKSAIERHRKRLHRKRANSPSDK